MKTTNNLSQKQPKVTKRYLSPLFPSLRCHASRALRAASGRLSPLRSGSVKSFFPCLFFAIFASFVVNLPAQTTLSGDHVITGDLDVGATGTPGNLTVNGETGNTALPGVKVTGDGGVLFTGSYGVGQIPATGAGTRFMWYPKKAALRVGQATGTGANWNDSNIGEVSIAFGYNTVASGSSSIAFGSYTTASGEGATAFGYDTTASGGWGGTTAFGFHTTASGETSTAFGNNSTASGPGATAFGVLTTASEDSATAFGCFSTASGFASTAMGYKTLAESPGTVAVGLLNIGGGSAWEFIETDPIFEIGNGWYDEILDEEIRHNAMTVLRNGKTTIAHRAFDDAQPAAGDFDNTNQNERVALKVEGHADFAGKVRMPRQGDILMGEFGNPE